MKKKEIETYEMDFSVLSETETSNPSKQSMVSSSVELVSPKPPAAAAAV